MQEENQNFSEFFERTRVLADRLGIPVVELPEIIGVSKAMLFAYRKGKYPISWKAWRKLEAAEAAAGIGQKFHAETFASQEAAAGIGKTAKLAVLPPPMEESERKRDGSGEREGGERVPAECPAGIARLEELLGEVLASQAAMLERIGRQEELLERLMRGGEGGRD